MELGSIELYTFERADGSEDTFTTTDVTLARGRAERHGFRLIANTYEFCDSKVVADHTPNGEQR